jgi:hypothetical protein
MLLFLSWSGARSKAVAEVLERWLGQVIQAVEPWISVDIDKGARWGPEIAERLEQSRVGIICLTRDNLESRWILFEAGALSKTKDAYVCTFLLGISPADVEPPLAQFQHTTFEKADVARLLRTINSAVTKQGERGLAETVLAEVFETFWPALEMQLKAILEQPVPAATPARSTTEILDEILTTVRGLDRRIAKSEQRVATSEAADLLQHLHRELENASPYGSRPMRYWKGDPLRGVTDTDLGVLRKYFEVLAGETGGSTKIPPDTEPDK